MSIIIDLVAILPFYLPMLITVDLRLLMVIDACKNNPETGRGDQDNLLSDDFTKGFHHLAVMKRNNQNQINLGGENNGSTF